MNFFQVVFLCSTKKLFEKFLVEAVSNSEILPSSTTQSDFCAVTQEGKKGETCHSYGHSHNVYRGKSLLVFEIPKKEKPAKLTFLYYFKKTWEEESKKKGQIDIEISKAPWDKLSKSNTHSFIVGA